MNYRHLYHAGNFFDVVKHILFLTLIDSLPNKNLNIIDAFASLGFYNIKSQEAQKTKEYEFGISKLLNKEFKNTYILKYLDIVKSFGENIYPGSSAIASKLLKPQDKLISCELHPVDFLTLKKNFRNNKNVVTHHIDAYNGFKAFLPPKNGERAIVLIDPSFEKKDEIDKIRAGIDIILKRCRNAVIMLWQPHTFRFQNDIFVIAKAQEIHAQCAFNFINAPFGFEGKIREIFAELVFWEFI